MQDDRRTDRNQAMAVNAAIRIDTLWGCVNAWRYLRSHGIARAIAIRVLRIEGPRRGTDNVHPAVRDALARVPEEGAGQRGGGAPVEPGQSERTNVAAAFAVEQAIRMASTEGRHYAESLLRIYGLDTATVMRVLFEPHRRRRPS